MATTDNQGGAQTSPARKTSTRRTGAKRATSRRTSSTTRRSTARRSTTTSTAPRTTAQHVQELAERAVLVPVGASLLARDNLVSTVRGLATKYSTKTSFERELKRYERRGASARNRFERQVRRTRTKFERQLRQRRSLIERTVKQNRRRVGREVRAARKDFTRQSGAVGSRAQKLVSDAQGLISQLS